MNRMAKENESALKRFLKRKVSYTSGLLVSFLITGSISIATSVEEAAEQVAATRDNYMSSLEAERAYVQEILAENERRLAEANREYLTLLRKGDFYSKPAYPSNQIFLNFAYENSGRYKNRTTNEWANTIEAIKYRMAGYTLPKGKNPYHAGEIIAMSEGQFATYGYNPETSLDDPRYLRAAFERDAYGRLVSLPVNPATDTLYYTDINGNNYYEVYDASGTMFVVNGLGIAVALDELGDVVLENSLRDPNINGNIPAGGIAGITPRINGNDPYDNLLAGNGVYIREIPHMASLEIGANIMPLDPEIPSVSKNVSVSVNTPVLGSIPSIPVAPSAPANVSISVNAPVINVTAPSVVPSIVVNTPSGVNANINIASPSVSVPTVTVPNFEQKVIEDPTVPSAPVVIIPNIVEVSFGAVSIGNGDPIYADGLTNPTGSSTGNALIAHVAVQSGTFDLKRVSPNSWDVKWEDYVVKTHIGATTAGTTSVGNNTVANIPNVDITGWTNIYSSAGTGFLKLVGRGSTYTNATYNVIRESSGSGVNLGELVHIDVHTPFSFGTIRNQLDSATRDGSGVLTDGIRDINAEVLAAFDDVVSPANGYTNYATGLAFVNSGTINLNGGNLSVTNQYDHGSTSRDSFVINTGTVNITPYGTHNDYNAAFLVSNDSNVVSNHIMYNGISEKIDISTNSSAAFVINNGGTQKKDIAIVNKGLIVMSGENAMGVYAKSLGANKGDLHLDFTAPIILSERESLGLYITNGYDFSDIYGDFKVTISGGSNNVGIFSYKDIKSPLTLTTGLETFEATVELSGGNSNIGLLPKGVDYVIDGGEINVSGGISNIGIAVTDENSLGGKSVTTDGNVLITGGNQSTAAYASGPGNLVTINGDSSAINATDSVAFYAKDSGIIEIKGDLDISDGIGGAGLTGVGSVGLLAGADGIIEANQSGTTININVDDGAAIYAIDSGLVEAQGSTIIVGGNSKAAIISKASPGYIGTLVTAVDLTGATVEYSGDGIALYAPWESSTQIAGIIDMTGATLRLVGQGSGWTKDMSPSSTVQIDFTGMNLVVDRTSTQDEVIIVNLKNATVLTVDNGTNSLRNDVVPIGITVDPSSTSVDYKWASSDGGIININSDINRTAGESTDGEFYFRRFLGQRQNLNLLAGNKVTATLNNADAADYYDGNVVGLNMSSSGSGTGTSWLNNTSITLLSGSTIVADRTDSGAGAIGAYINYGEVKNDGRIEVERSEGINVNDSAVGIFAVNGSTVENLTSAGLFGSDGVIEVAGDNSIGILAQSEREDPNTNVAIPDEFGTGTTDQGQLNVTNNGIITLYGDGSIGIYGDNNGSKFLPDNVITNSAGAEITVGNDESIGIYGTGLVTIINNGIIEVGTDSYGIYAGNGAEVDAASSSLGTYVLDDNSIGIVTDPLSQIDGLATATPVDINLQSNGTGAIGITFVNNSITPLPPQHIININVNDTTLNTTITVTDNSFIGGTVFYVEDSVLSSNGIVNVADDGIGVYAEEAAAINSNTLTTGGVINLVGDRAIGLYTRNGAIGNRNGASININKDDQYGMVVLDDFAATLTIIPPVYAITGGFAYNNGDININIQDGKGIYAGNGAAVSLNGSAGNINFNSTDSFGVVSDGAVVGIGTSTEDYTALSLLIGTSPIWGGVTHDPTTVNNVLILAQRDVINNKYSTIINEDLTVGNPTTPAPSGTIGVYLNGDGHTYEDVNGGIAILSGITVWGTSMSSPSLKVNTGAIGVYSSSDNSTVDNKILIDTQVRGNLAVGVYLDGKGEIGGTLDVSDTTTNAGNAIGIYGRNGLVTVNDYDGDSIGLDITLGSANLSGTGMYLESGSLVTGASIKVTNTSANTNAGIYYDGVTGVHDTDIILDGSNVVGIFANNGANITYGNKNMTEISGGTNRYAFIAGESTATNPLGYSTVTNAGTATFTSQDSIVMYTENGAIINTGIINTTGTAAGIEGAMVLNGNVSATSDIVGLTNTGTINVVDSLGLVIDSTSATTTGAASNSGTIDVTNTGGVGTKAVAGIALFGDGTTANVTYDGTGSMTKINTGDAVGLYLNNTVGNQVIDAGMFDIVKDSVAVYSDASEIDFDLYVQGTDGVGVYATNTTLITNNIIDISAMQQGTGVYINTNAVTLDNVTINAIDTTGVKELLAMYVNDNYNIGSNTGNVAINVDGGKSTGVYVSNSNTVSLDTGATLNVDNNALGIYVDGTGALPTQLDTNGGVLNLGNNAIGVFNSGTLATSNLGVVGPLTVNFNGSGEILAFNVGGNLNIGNNITVTGTGTLGFTYNGNMTNAYGNVVVAAGEIGFLSKFDNTAPTGVTYILENQTSGGILVNGGGIGMVVENDVMNPHNGVLTLKNDGVITVDGTDAIGLYSNSGVIDNSSGVITVDNKGVGIFATRGVSNIDVGTTTVTSGVGLAVDNLTNPIPTITGIITLGAGTATDYNIGSYFIDFNGDIATTPLVVTNNYTINTAVEGGTNNIVTPVTITGSNTNEIGIFAKNSDTTLTNNVTVSGDENIGIYGSSATITGSLVTVSTATGYNSANPYAESSIGAYLTDGAIGNIGTVTANDNSIGVFGDDGTVLNLTNINTGYRAIGAYVNDNSQANLYGVLTTGVSGYGVFADNSNVDASNVVMNVSDGTSIGILSQGTGNIDFTGYVNVLDKDTNPSGLNNASIGIYKGNGTGVLTIDSTTDWNIGKGGYGVYVENKDYAGAGIIRLDNHANMNLGESAVGIYVGGNGTRNAEAYNYGVINVGTTYLGVAPPGDHSNLQDHLNSVGMYVGNGAYGANNGTINVKEMPGTNTPGERDHSVGVYAVGLSTVFDNNGIITVDEGGVGILAKDGATIRNYGDILLGTIDAHCGAETVGIGAYGTIDSSSNEITTTVENYGYIEVGKGVGIFGNQYADLVNKVGATIRITEDGTGMLGFNGRVVNNGVISIDSGATGNTMAHTTTVPVIHGAITIVDGTVIVNNNFIHAGTLIADNVYVDGAYVSIANATGDPMFVVDSITGNINLEPDFITTGNGYGWTVPNFVNNVTSGLSGASGGASTLNIMTSPLFVANMTDQGSLVVAKQPYAYLVSGDQFDNLYNGVDSLLALDQAGTGNASNVLKDLNAYLDNIYRTQGEDAFASEANRTMAEMRGDIYSTIQTRMQKVQGAFDNSFNELLISDNFTRDTGKYSVIYQQGDFKDKTLGIDDYDYRVQGLLYMKENEGRKFGNKWGYSLGFAVSRFDFDDAPTFNDKSKEDVYSVRTGVHNVHSFGEDDTVRLVSRFELGYNRHKSERTLELDRVYKNEAKYNSYQVTFDNKLEKDFYRSLTTTIKGYAGLNLEYGYVEGFKESAKGDSSIELGVKSNDYFSVVGEVGVSATKRVHLGKKMSMKLVGDLAYGHEFGNNYDRNKAKVDKGTEGYYSLIKPAEEKGHVKGRVGVTVEKNDSYGVTFDVEARQHQNKKNTDVRFGVKFNYKFMN